METDMVRSEKFPKGIGQQVLAAVLLHMVKASLPVYLSLNFGASCHGGFGFMEDVTIFFPDMDYGNSLFSNKKLTCITELTADYDSAVWRARNVAAPKLAQQMNHKTPCAMKAGKCYDCKSPERICRGMVTLWGPMAGTQVEVLLVDEDLGL